MSAGKKPSELGAQMTRKMVVEYLKSNPEFFRENPELITLLTPPAQDLGEGVVDLQHYILGNLQKNFRDPLKGLPPPPNEFGAESVARLAVSPAGETSLRPALKQKNLPQGRSFCL